jgi:hypothetical protein
MNAAPLERLRTLPVAHSEKRINHTFPRWCSHEMEDVSESADPRRRSV